MSTQEIVLGDCLEVLRRIRVCCVDAVVTDPPYELNMMGLDWDRTGITFSVEFWREVLRVCKPGAHLAVNAAGRLYHRVACAIHDAGFEPRELFPWIFGTGQFLGRTLVDGVGTRLKTGAEPIGIFRKPPEGDLSLSFAKWGTGGLYIDRCRMPYVDENDLVKTKKKNPGRSDKANSNVYGRDRPQQLVDERGRLPSNLVIDEEVAVELGWRAKYFYCVKASREEKDAGLDLFPDRTGGESTKRKEGSVGLKNSRAGAGRTGGQKNGHQTVKPIDLVRRLIRLIAPPNGLILDPFAGSGTTLCAAALEGFDCIGIEKESEYVDIARARLAYWQKEANGNQEHPTGSTASVSMIATSTTTETKENDPMANLPADMAEAAGKARSAGGGNYIQHGDYIFLIKKWFYQQIQDRCVITEFLVIDAKKKKVFEGEKLVEEEPNPVGSECSYTVNYDGEGKLSAPSNARAVALGLFGFKEGEVADKLVADTLAYAVRDNSPASGMLLGCSTFPKEIRSKKGNYITGINWVCVNKPKEGLNGDVLVQARLAALARSPEECVKVTLEQMKGAPAPAFPEQKSAPQVPTLPGASSAPPAPPSIPVVDPFAGWTVHPNDPNFYYQGSIVKSKAELLAAAGRQ